MNEFLLEARRNLGRIDEFDTVQVVMGNESCDLDSAVSALVFGLYLSRACSGGNGPSKRVATLPLLNIPQSELPLKTEVMFFFNENDIPVDLLIFRDELDVHRLHASGRLALVLVDHHSLPPGDRALAQSVSEVLDHRPRDPHAPPFPPHAPVDLRPVGSCCTLVADRLTATKAGQALLTRQVAMLLFGPILLDTACLSEAAGRATRLDRDVAARLRRRLRLSTPTPSEGGVGAAASEGASQATPLGEEELFGLLVAARANSALALPPRQLLARDLKVVEARVPIASLPMLVEEFADLPDAGAAMESFCSERRFPALLLMGLRIDADTKALQRDIGIFSPRPATPSSNASPTPSAMLAEQLASLLRRSREPPLELEPVRLGKSGAPPPLGLTVFRQGNHRASRKQVLPVVRAHLALAVDDIVGDVGASSSGSVGVLGSSGSLGSAFENRVTAVKTPLRARNGFTSPFGLYRTSSPSRCFSESLRPSPQPLLPQQPAALQLLDYATSDTLRALHRLDPSELVARVESKRSRLRAARERLEREEAGGVVGAVVVGAEGGRVLVMGARCGAEGSTGDIIKTTCDDDDNSNV
ncbi:exopolyphosphatase PRUNE1 [Ischnura elegans]|uniref:exopolyphosphatase PRUNE1 n=1 Tax=Ischnura elegans TaxID=197161 RepID=UPI001ED88343|nr:exopolyphosphatase PRUNE1 [Ischnura elegans]